MSQHISKISEVKQTTGLSRSSIYRLASKGEFPKPIKLSERSSGWIMSEVEQWLNGRIEASRNGEEC